jgi:hypothetical protein
MATKKKIKEPRILKLPLPPSMQRYLIFAASVQNFELIPPTELALNIAAYIMEGRGARCLETDKAAKLKAYLNKWKIVDFTNTLMHLKDPCSPSCKPSDLCGQCKGEKNDRVS